MRRILFIITACALFTGCGDEIADESYATTGLKSINGIDAFLVAARATGKTVVHTAYLSEEAQKADVIIHFEKTAGYPEHVYRQLEAWMSGLDPADLEDTGEMVHSDTNLAAARSSTPARPRQHFAPDPGANEDADDGEDPDAVDSEESEEAADPAQAEEQLKQVVFIYFLRDTDSSVEFWTRLVRQMEGHPEEKRYSEIVLGQRKEKLESVPEELPMPFGTRMLLNGRKTPVLSRDLHSEELEVPPALPYRYLQLALPELSLDAPFHFRTLLDGDGQDLIREFYLNRGRVIMVYNAASFLNWPMARKEQSAFARALLDYALKDSPAAAKIAVIDRLPVPPETQKDEEQDPFRLFTVFPLSVIFFQMLVFLLIFLLARARAGQPLRSEPPHGSRDFTEHFKALGNLLKKGKLE